MAGIGAMWRSWTLEDMLRVQIHDLRFWSISPSALASDAVMWTEGRAGQIRAGRMIYGIFISNTKHAKIVL